MSETIQYTRSVPVEYTVDVCVAGGGPAGLAAAITAARNGARIFLGEGAGCFGGLGTSGLVPAFFGLGNGREFLGGRICGEVLDRLHTDPAKRKGGFLPFQVEPLKLVYDAMVREAGMDFALDVRLIDIRRDASGRLTEAVFSDDSDGGLFAVRASVFVDATGNGDLATWAGAEYDQGNDRGVPMPSSLCTLWNGVDWKTYRASGVRLEPLVKQAIDDGFFTFRDYHHSGMFQVGEGRSGGNFTHAFGLRANDHRSRTRGWMDLRLKLPEYQRFYQKYVPGFEKAELAVSAAQLGIRECRRIRCEYTLTIDDFKARASFPDEIGRFAYPVDIHPLDDSMQEFERFKRDYLTNLRYGPGESYGIPYRALIPRRTTNLLVAGRCISADQPMSASVRVMPGCFLTGQAAGAAAALAAAHTSGLVRDIDLHALQDLVGHHPAL